MTNIELALNMLTEASTTEISSDKASGYLMGDESPIPIEEK